MRLGRTKVAASTQRLPIGAGGVAALARHRPPLAERVVFPNGTGKPLDPARVAYQFDKEQARLGLHRIRPHDLRHTAATLMLQAGIPPKVVSERLGHSSIVVTMNRYAHFIEGMQTGRGRGDGRGALRAW